MAARTKPLTPLELHALKIAAKRADDLRDELRPGQLQDVDFCLHVAGVICVGESSLTTISKKPTAQSVLERIWASVSPTTQARLAEELEADLVHGRAKQVSGEVTGQIEALLARLSSSSPLERRGSVTGQIELARLPKKAAAA